jgi:hypothetical protein
MSFAGDLRGIGLADIFQNIAHNQGTGTLCVRVRREESFLRFEGGAVAACSAGIGRGLGLLDHLVQRRVVDESVVQKLIARHRRSRRSPLMLLVDKGVLEESAIRAAAEESIAEAVYDLFSLRDAEFRFDQGEGPARVFEADVLAIGIRLQVGPLLMEAARRRDEGERIARVVTSPQDLFVLLEGWDEFEWDESVSAIAPLLDGRHSVAAVVAASGRSRFVIQKAIHDLVQAGFARPCSERELLTMAEDALRDGDQDAGLATLEKAVHMAPGDRALRERFAEALATAGRAEAASNEFARLAHDAAEDDRTAEALDFQRRAVELSPEDIAKGERFAELLASAEERTAFVDQVLALVGRMRAMGLAQRARERLNSWIEARGSRAEVALVAALADVESELGHWRESSRIYRELGERVLHRDELAGLTWLRAAARQDPQNEDLARKVHDLETGRAARLCARRRRLGVGALAAALLLTGLTAITLEAGAARRVAHGLGLAMAQGRSLEAIEPLADLAAMDGILAMTPSGRRAEAWLRAAVDAQFEFVREDLARGDFDAAAARCAKLSARIPRADVMATVHRLEQRVETERAALGVLRALDDSLAEPSAAELAALAVLAAPEHLEFLLARVPHVRHAAVRQILLDALARLQTPRAVVPAVAAALRFPDGPTQVALDSILTHVDEWRAQGHEAAWDAARDLLVEHAHDRERMGLVRRLGSLLWPDAVATPLR